MMYSPGKRFKLFVTSLDFTQGKLVAVWGQHESRFDDYAALETLLNNRRERSDISIDGQFHEGDIVIARYEDGNWYRSQILEERPDKKFKVSFMDFGNRTFVSESDMWVGEVKLFDHPPLATQFILGDICAQNNIWSVQEKSVLEQELLNMEIHAEVIGSGAAGLQPTIRLHDSSGNLVSKKLLSHGAGTSYDNEHLKLLHIQPCKLTVGKVYPVYISYSESSMKFWVQLKSLEKHVEQMQLKLLEYVENGLLKLKPEEILKGMSCVAKYTTDDGYYRAVITSVNQDEEQCSVHFVDYGNTEKVAYSNLFMLPREEAMIHGLCVECSLSGKAVRTTDFTSLLESENVTVTVVSFTGNSYIVDLSNGTESQLQIESSSGTPIPYVPIEFDLTTVQDVCISHVEKDGTFHLQLVEYAPILESLMAQLGEKSTAPLLGTAIKGKPCVARDTSDMISYRGEVLANDIGTIRVKLVDFGNVESFSVGDLSGINHDYMKLPTQARHCVLLGADKLDTGQLFKLLKPYEACRVLVCSVAGKNNSGLLKVDLYDPDKQGIRLLDQVNNSSSNASVSSAPSSQTLTSHLNPSSSVFLPPAEVKSNSVERLYVMAVISDTDIYCQLSKYSQEKLGSFQSQLQEFYDTHNVRSISSPKVGDICCSKYSEDEQYYRSKVLSISGSMVTILFVDYGNQETVEVSALKELSPQFCNLPVQGVVCCFDDSYGGLNSEVLASLADRELLANVVKKEATKVHINLVDNKENADSLNILNKYMQPKNAGRSKNHLNSGFENQRFVKGMWDECFVTYADDPQNFYVQLTSHADDLNSVMEKLESYCAGADSSQVQTGLTLPVAAKFSDDGEWYRAIITGVLKNGNVEVFFVDFGNADTIPRSDLRQLTPELMETPVQAVKCTLNRIKPGSTDLWNPEDIEEFNKLVFDTTGSVIFKVQLGTYIETEDKYYVELFRKDVNVNETFLLSRGYLKTNETGPGAPPATLPFVPGEDKLQNSGWASGFIKTSQKQAVASDDAWAEPGGSTASSFGNNGKRGFDSGDPGSDFGSQGSANFSNKSDPFQQKSGGFGSFGDKQSGGFGTEGGGFNSGSSGGGFGKSRGFTDGGSGSDAGSGNKGGCFKCGEDGHISRNCPNSDTRQGGSRGGGGGWNRDEMLAMEVDKANVGKVIGKGGSRIKELQENSGSRIRILSKDATGDMIPVEIYGTEDQRTAAKEMIDQIVNATFGSGPSGSRRGQDRGFNAESSDSWDNSGQRSSDRFGGSGFNDGGRSGGFNRTNERYGESQQDSRSTEDWGDSGGTGALKNVSERNSFGDSGSRFNQNQASSFSRRDHHKEEMRGFSSSSDRGREGFRGGSHLSGQRYKESDLPLNQYKELMVTHHETPSLFYFQLQETYDKLEELMEKLQTFYGSMGVPDMALLNVIKDRICAAKYSEDNKWYRAKVVSAKGGMIRVFFVDYGNEEDVAPSCVKEIKDEFLYLPTQAIAGRVFGIQPKGGKWSLDAINRFIELTEDIVIGTAVEKGDDGTIVMELASNHHPIHDMLIKEGLAVEEHDDIPLPQAASRRKLSTSSASSTASSRAGDLRLREVTLPCGQSVEVYISYASSPAALWVNLTKNGPEMDDLMSKISQQYDNLSPGELTFASPEVGNLCCARYTGDKVWYRGKIKDVKRDKVLVNFVDYGNEEWMNLENIRQIVRSFTQFPAQAVQCILDGAVPVGGKWSNSGIEKFETLTVGDNLMAQINSREVPHYVSITQKESGVSVAEELINAGFAKQGRPVDQSCKFNPRILNKGDRVEVIISWVISHKEFYCQITSEGNRLLRLQEDLCQHYERCRLKDEMLHDPQVGDLCVAYYAGDGNWYRGIVVKVDEDQMALVKYIDYGNCEKVQKTKLKSIKEEFETLPTFAMKCRLKEQVGSGQINWNEKAMQLFHTLMQEKLTCCIESVVKDGQKVDLLDSSGRSIVDRLLGRENKVSNHSGFESRGDSFGGQNNDRMQVGKHFRTGNDQFSNDRFGSSRGNAGGQSRSFGDPNRKEGFGRREDRSGFNTERRQDNRDSQQRETKFDNRNPGFGNSATTFSAGGEDWGDEPAQVKPIQSTPAISTISQKKVSLPGQTVSKGKQKGYISSVTSPGDFYVQLLSQENEILEKTDQLTAEYEALAASDRKDISVSPGQICCAKFEEDEAWYRAKIVCVNRDQSTVEFIDYGNSATVASSSLRSLSAEYCKTPPLAYNCKLNKFHVYKENDTKKLQEISEEGVKVLLVEFLTTTAPPYKVSLYDPAIPEVSLSTQLPSFSEQPAEVGMASYPKVNIPQGEVVGYVSHISSPSSFAVQLQSQEDNLANVTSLLEGYTSAGDKLANVVVGAACVAQFSEDEAWYRSIVISLDGGDKATVEFVDYGNRDTVQIDKLKELSEPLLKDPPFAISCSLDGVTATSFTDEVIEAFSAHTVDKVSKIKFSAPKEPCSVVIYENDVCVNDKIKELLPLDAEPVAKFPPQPALSGRYQAFVHHIETPAEFYFQLLRDEHDKNALYDQLDQIYEENSVEILTSLQVGAACCVKDSVNHTWNRSEVVHIADKVTVQFIDFGNCEEVNKEDARILRPQFLDQHALSYKARLSGVVLAADKEWPQDVSDKLFEETVEKVINIDIKSKDPPYEAVLQYNNLNLNDLVLEGLGKEFLCDSEEADTESEQYESAVDEVPDEFDGESQGDDTTITPADGTSTMSVPVNSQVRDGDANLYSDLQDTFDEGGSIDRSVTPVPAPLTQFKSGDMLIVYIAHHVSPSQFWVHLESQQEDLDQFTESLQQYYSSCGESVKAEDVYTGMMCVAKYSDDQWYRAAVKSVTDAEVEVLFIDFGNTETVALSELRAVSENFHTPLPYAIACVLHGVRAKDGEWEEVSMETFESLSAEQKLTAEVVLVNCDEGESLYVVKLFDSSGNSLAQAMLEQGVAEDVTSPLVRSRKNSKQSEEEIQKGDEDIPKFSDSLLEEPETEVARQVDTIDTGTRHFSVDEVQDTPAETKSGGNDDSEIAQDIEQDEVDGFVQSKEGNPEDTTEDVGVVSLTETDTSELAEIGSQSNQGEQLDEHQHYKDAELSEHKIEQIENNETAKDLEDDEKEDHIEQNVDNRDNEEDLGGLNAAVAVTESEIEEECESTNVQVLEPNKEVDRLNEETAEDLEDDEKEDHIEQNVDNQDIKEDSEGINAAITITESIIKEECESTNKQVLDTNKQDDKLTVLGTISEDHIKLGCKIEGQVVYVKSPDKFWIHLKEFSERFEILVTEMQEYYSGLAGENVLDRFEESCCCAAYSQDDDTWYRAVVKSSTEDTGEVTVSYIDYGNEECVSVENLRKLEEKFVALPCQALECCLCDVEPNDGTEWDLEVTDLLSEITLDKNLLIQVQGRQGQVHQVSLLDMGLPVANRLVAESLARRVGCNPDLTVDESRLDMTTVAEVERIEEGIEEQEQSSDNQKESAEEEESEEIKEPKDVIVFHQPVLVEGSTVDVYIPHVDSPHSFYCQLVTSSAELPLFTDKLVDFYSNLKDGEGLLEDLTIGQACVAKFSADMSWYRATVTEISEKGVHVFFVDYGNSEIVGSGNLRTIQQEFVDFPVQVFRCSISSLLPVTGADWDEDSCSRLQELSSGIDTYDNKVFKAEVKMVEHTENGVIEIVDVNIWDGEVNLSEQLVQGGYARIMEDHADATPERSSDPDINQFAAKIVSSTIEMGKKKFLKEKKETGLVEEAADDQSNQKMSSSGHHSGYKLVELQEGNEVEVQLLHAKSPDDISLKLNDQSAKDLAILTSAENPSATESVDDGKNFEVGDPCMCVDTDTNQLERALILSVEDDTYEVNFVDQEKTATIAKELVSSINDQLVEIPTQVIRCKLAGIVPVSENVWSEEACDELKVLCREKELTAQIVEKVNNEYSVYLHNYKEDMTLSVNHQLVRQGLAAFAEGYAMDLQCELNSKIESSFNDISLCMSNSLGSLDESAVVESCDEDAFSHLVYHVGQTVESVFVNCNENQLICQPLETHQQLQDMNLALNECYDAGEEPTLQDPQTGQPCCVKSAVDDNWHRAVIQDIKSVPVPIAKCYAVDTGDCVASSLEKVKLLQQRFFALPSQAIVVRLTGLEDLSGKTTEIYNFLESNFVDEDGKVRLLLQVDRVNSENSVQATVFMNSGNTIKDELLENEVVSPQPKDEGQEVNTSSDADNTESKLDVSRVKSLPESNLCTDVSHSVVISHAENPNSFWCRLSTQLDDLQHLMADYDSKVESAKDLHLEEGDFCVAYFSEKKCWRRAKIQSEYGGVYSVQFVDYGVCDTTERVLPMTASLSDIPIQAIHCMLPHLQPRDTDWSEEVELLLGSYIEERQLFTMHIESLGDGQPASVKLYLGENEGQSLMNLLLDRKLARTALSSATATSDEKGEQES